MSHCPSFLFFVETKPEKNNEVSLKCILKMEFRLVSCAVYHASQEENWNGCPGETCRARSLL